MQVDIVVDGQGNGEISAPAVRIERDGVAITVEDGPPDTVNRIVEALGRPPEPQADGGGTDLDGYDFASLGLNRT